GHAAFESSGGYESVDFGAVSEILEGLFGDVFGRRRRSSGRDIEYRLEISFEEAARGCEKTISVERTGTCDGCGGSGAEPGAVVRSCSACNGRGQVRYQRGFFA